MGPNLWTDHVCNSETMAETTPRMAECTPRCTPIGNWRARGVGGSVGNERVKSRAPRSSNPRELLVSLSSAPLRVRTGFQISEQIDSISYFTSNLQRLALTDGCLSEIELMQNRFSLLEESGRVPPKIPLEPFINS